jgi:hypothetical protein
MSLIIFGFSSSAGLTAVSAEPWSVAIVSSAPDLFRRPIELTRSVETVTSEAVKNEATAEAINAPDRAEVVAASEEEGLFELGPNASVVHRRVDPGEATGGFLRTNPGFQRKNRKELGLSLRF